MPNKQQQEQPVICQLCGLRIEAIKGKPQQILDAERTKGIHMDCDKARNNVLRKYGLTFENHVKAFMDSITVLFPQVNEQPPIKLFRLRSSIAENELEALFPHYKAVREIERGAEGVATTPPPKPTAESTGEAAATAAATAAEEEAKAAKPPTQRKRGGAPPP
jgi:hypothetical protein